MSQLQKRIQKLQRRDGPAIGFGRVSREQPRAMALIATARTAAEVQEALAAEVDAVVVDAGNAAGARARHPRTRLVVRELDPDARGLRVSVCCGGEGFARALGALLENACQGNGVRPRGQVELRVSVRREVGAAAGDALGDAGWSRR